MKDTLIKIKNVLKEHYLIIALSFLLVFLIFAPLLVFPYVIKNEYQGINFNRFGSDAHFYLTRGREVLDGHGLGDPLLKEGKDSRDIYSAYSEYILLAPIKLLGLAQKVNITAVYNIYNFIGVFFLIILVYLLVLQLSGNKLLSAAAALFMIGGYSIVYNKALFYSDFNVYARVIYPYFSSLIMFAYLNLLVAGLKSAELKYKIFAGLAFGLLFYIYFYAWTFILALNVFLLLIYIAKKNFAAAKKVLFIGLLGLALGSYYLIGLLATLNSGHQASYFMMMSYGHKPIFSLIGFLTLILFAVFWYKRRDDKNMPFIFAIILGGWFALNQQVITGQMLQYGHYYWYFIVPLSIAISFYMIWRLITNKKLRKYLFLLLIAVVFLNTAGGQYKSFFANLEVKKYDQNFRPIIDALNRDKSAGVILAADGSDEYLFTIYTPHDLFWHSFALANLAPIDRAREALFVYFYFNNQARNDFKNYLLKIIADQDQGFMYQYLFRNLEGYQSGLSFYDYGNKFSADDQSLAQNRAALIDQLTKEYNEAVIKDGGINKILKKYGVNYIVWDKNKNPEWDLSFLGKNIREIASSNNIYLYQLQP